MSILLGQLRAGWRSTACRLRGPYHVRMDYIFDTVFLLFLVRYCDLITHEYAFVYSLNEVANRGKDYILYRWSMASYSD